MGRSCSPGSYGDRRWWFSITTAAAGRDWAKGATGGHSGPQGPQMSANPWHPARLKSVRQNLSAAEAGTQHGTRSSAAGPATDRPAPLASKNSEKGTDRDVDAGLNSAQNFGTLPPTSAEMMQSRLDIGIYHGRIQACHGVISSLGLLSSLSLLPIGGASGRRNSAT